MPVGVDDRQLSSLIFQAWSVRPATTLGTMPAAEKARATASRQLIVGTYEHAVVGFGVEKSDVGVRASLTFTNAVHAGAVRCVAAWNGFLSSGGADEAIQLCDLTRRVELGSLLQHQATVTSLEFHASDGRCYMFSASDDGVICAWKCPRWECVHMLKGHRGAVNSLSVHPTGRLALSVGFRSHAEDVESDQWTPGLHHSSSQGRLLRRVVAHRRHVCGSAP